MSRLACRARMGYDSILRPLRFAMPCLLPDRLHTPRLVLRAPRLSDAAVLYGTYTQDAEIARYMVWRPHVGIEETEAFLEGCVRDWAAGVRRPYILTLREGDDRAIGMLEARQQAHTVEIGYVLARTHWGRGLMPEAIRAMTATVLAHPTCFRVEARCDVDNRASARALEKAGFAREGRLARSTVHPNLDAAPRACYLYAACR